MDEEKRSLQPVRLTSSLCQAVIIACGWKQTDLFLVSLISKVGKTGELLMLLLPLAPEHVLHERISTRQNQGWRAAPHCHASPPALHVPWAEAGKVWGLGSGDPMVQRWEWHVPGCAGSA